MPGFGLPDGRAEPVCVYVDGAWCVYALHVLVQCGSGEGEVQRWESAHAHHGTRMWREFVAVRREWADRANGYNPTEAERLAYDAAEELSSDESDAGLPPLEPAARRAARPASAEIETEVAD